MPKIRPPAAVFDREAKKRINWYPGHMMAGMKAMIGKLNTVDCVVEVHDARLPFTGRNTEFRQHLGLIKPRLLLLNKADLADLSRWDHVKTRLAEQGDTNVMLTDFSGHEFAMRSKIYGDLLQNVIDIVYNSDRHNRSMAAELKIMIVGIPNVGKSTLINRLRQNFLGLKGEPAKVGASAGVTKAVHQTIKICARPPIYSIDTPGVLAPGTTKNHERAMQLALCSNINDNAVEPLEVAKYLLDYMNMTENYTYARHYERDKPFRNLKELMDASLEMKCKNLSDHSKLPEAGIVKIEPNDAAWKFISLFRQGLFGLVMFD